MAPADDHRHPGRRITVVGTSGCGKTHVAGLIAEALGIRWLNNDAIIWRPNWVQTPDDERERLFHELLADESWVLDGNFCLMNQAEHPHIMERLDTVIWLDLPRREVWPQLLRRTVRRALTREELFQGNRESLRMSFLSRESILLWSLQTFSQYRQLYGELMDDPRLAHAHRIRLRSRAEVREWVAGLRSPTQPA